MAGNQHTLGGRPSTTYRAKSVTWCPLCNSRYVGIPNHGRKRYVCSNFRDLVTDEKKCAPPSLAGDPMETALLGAIRDALGYERQLEASLSEKRRELAAGANAPEIEHLKKQLEQIRRREEKADPRRSKPPRPAMRTRKPSTTPRYAKPARSVEIQNQLRAKTVGVDFKVDVKAIAAAVRKGLKLATPEQQQRLIQGVVRRVTPLSAKEIEIEFSIPVGALNTVNSSNIPFASMSGFPDRIGLGQSDYYLDPSPLPFD